MEIPNAFKSMTKPGCEGAMVKTGNKLLNGSEFVCALHNNERATSKAVRVL